MARKKDFAIIGLGSFGKAVALSLLEKKCNVTVIDKDARRIDNFIAENPRFLSAKMDTTVAQYLEDYGIKNFDCVIVAMSTDLEAAILTIISLKEAGVENIIAKVRDDRHDKILHRLGVKKTILRDEISASITAVRAMFDIDSNIQVVDENYVALELVVDNNALNGKQMSELGALKRVDFNIIHITRNNKIILAGANELLKMGDKLFIIAKTEKVNQIREYFADNSEDLEITQELDGI